MSPADSRFLEPLPADPPGTGAGQVKVAYRYLWKEGQPPDALGVLNRHPELKADKSLVLDLAYEEYCQRTENGEAIERDVFCGRFPRFQSSLRRLLDAHDYLHEHPELLPDEAAIAWPRPGQPFLDYQIVRQLGRGAFARVYLAVEPALGNRLVTLKVTPFGAAEAETLGRLNHPHIVPVYQVRSDPGSGLTVICMPYLGEATLTDVLDRLVSDGLPAKARDILEAAQAGAYPELQAPGGLPPDATLRRGGYVDGILHIGVQLAEALAFVHARGICHQDIKPSNVLLGPDGRPRLLDFNLATDVLTRQRCLGGTLPYMAPEQLRAVAAADEPYTPPPDPRTDLFALGVVLYELLAGEHPFGVEQGEAAVAEQCQKLLEKQRRGPRPLEQLNPRAGARVSRLVGRCLAFRPENRPQTAAELAGALRQAASPLARCRRQLAYHRRAAGSVAVVVLLVLGGLLYVQAVQPPRWVSEYRSGMTSYAQGRYDAAVEHFSASLAAAPDSPWVLVARGRAYLQIGDVGSQQLALLDLQKAHTLRPEGRIKAAYGYAMNRGKNPREAIFLYRQAEKAGFAPAAVYNNLGYCYLQLGGAERESARTCLDQALRLDPDLTAAYHNRAWCYLFSGLDDRQRSPGEALKALRLGLADIRLAIAKAADQGLPTAELYHDAARLCAVAVGLEDGWSELAWEFLECALAAGVDPRKVLPDQFFTTLAGPRFSDLAARPAPVTALPGPQRVLDPLVDFPDT